MESLTEILRLALVAFGIGSVIFVHELGHFLAARLCGVRVETFSLGLGPKLLGWRRGATTYQIAALPLGGFCRMAGEERRLDGLPPRPDELPAKSVGARFFIYSGGVLMNVVFGLVVFPILFANGISFIRPVLGTPTPGSPIWHARLAAGTEVLEVNGDRILNANHIRSAVALGDPEETRLLVRDPQTGAERVQVLEPEYHPASGLLEIGVRPPIELDAHGHAPLDVREGTPAYEAGLRTDDRLVEVVGGRPGADYETQLDQLMVRSLPLTLRVAGAEGEQIVRIEPRETGDLDPPRIGVRQVQNFVRDVRNGPETSAIDLRPGDEIVTAQGRTIRDMDDFEAALLEDAGPLRLAVDRGGRRIEVSAPALPRAAALSFCSDLYLAPGPHTTRVVVSPGEPADRAGLRDGDRIQRIDGTPVETWTDIVALIGRAAAEDRPAVFSIERPAETPAAGATHLDVAIAPEAQPRREYGFQLRVDQYVYRSASLAAAVKAGAVCSWKFLEDSWLTLKRIVLGQVSGDQMGGIITIGVVSYTLAESGWEKLFFFLAMLSINLAFLNVLPIPVLDGGHLFFLLVEKIKGSPVSERVLAYSQMVGVVLILSLMVYVTYNDLVRFVFPR